MRTYLILALNNASFIIFHLFNIFTLVNLDIALERETEGDLIVGDMGQVKHFGNHTFNFLNYLGYRIQSMLTKLRLIIHKRFRLMSHL